MLALDTGQIWWSRELSSYRGLALDGAQLYVATSDGSVVALRRTRRHRGLAAGRPQAARPERAGRGRQCRRRRRFRRLPALARPRHRQVRRARTCRRRAHLGARRSSSTTVSSSWTTAARSWRTAAASPQVADVLPVLALVGRPNVGKSTLFNALTHTRDALVADVPGLTRDRKYGYARRSGYSCVVIDTGGLVETVAGIERLMAEQTLKAIEEADRVLLVVDARQGCTPQDLHVADVLRRSGKQVLVVANKSEGLDDDMAAAEFHRFGFGEPIAISSAHLHRHRSPDGARARRLRNRDRRAGLAAAQRRRGHPRRRRRPAERRQVDADQPAARRGTADRIRPARHDARHGRGAVRARRPPLHADRHGRRAAQVARQRDGREVQHCQDVTSDRSSQCRDRRGRCARHDRRPGREPDGTRGRAGPGARDRGQQMGRHRARPARRRSATGSTCGSTSCVSRPCISSRRAMAPASAN